MLFLFVHYINVSADDLNAFVKAVLTCLDAKIVISHIRPFVTRVGFVILAAFTVDLSDLLFGFLTVKSANVHCVLYSVFPVSPDKQLKGILSVRKYKIRTASDDYAGAFFLRKLLDYLCLKAEKIFLGGKIRAVGL